MNRSESAEATTFAHRRRAFLVASPLLAAYFATDYLKSTGTATVVARIVWIAVLGTAALLQREDRPRLSNHAARVAAALSGVCSSLIVMGYGGTHGAYFGFLLATSFSVPVLVPDLPSCAIIAGIVTTLGGVAILLGEHQPLAVVLEWTAFSAVTNGLLGWGATFYRAAVTSRLAAERERTRAVEELRAAEEKLHAVFSSTSLGAVVVAVSGDILAANDSFQKMVGGSDRAAPGKNYFDLLAPEEVAEARERFANVAAGHPAPRTERRFVKSNGDVFLASVHASGIHARDGSITTLIVMIEDVSEAHRLREQLSKSERLATLGRLAAGVAHEINNPLAYIKSNLGWMREAIRTGRFERDEVATALDETDLGADRIARIVRELSVFVRNRDETAVTNVEEVTSEAVRLASPRLQSVPDLSITIAAGLPQVAIGKTHLSQALLNLLANAVDAIEARCESDPRAPRRIAVHGRKEGGAVEITVEDSGIGLSEAVSRHLFEPFFTTKGARGTGLGLAVSRENLMTYGASIEARCGSAGGALFCIRLPCAIESAAGRQPDPHGDRLRHRAEA